MAVNQHKPLPPTIIETDRTALVALRTLTDYAPPNATIRVEAVNTLEAELRHAEETEIVANHTLESARSARIAAGWKLHNTMLSVKAAVTSQYGANSDAVQALGLKKKSDYRRPTRCHTNGES